MRCPLGSAAAHHPRLLTRLAGSGWRWRPVLYTVQSPAIPEPCERRWQPWPHSQIPRLAQPGARAVRWAVHRRRRPLGRGSGLAGRLPPAALPRFVGVVEVCPNGQLKCNIGIPHLGPRGHSPFTKFTIHPFVARRAERTRTLLLGRWSLRWSIGIYAYDPRRAGGGCRRAARCGVRVDLRTQRTARGSLLGWPAALWAASPPDDRLPRSWTTTASVLLYLPRCEGRGRGGTDCAPPAHAGLRHARRGGPHALIGTRVEGGEILLTRQSW